MWFFGLDGHSWREEADPTSPVWMIPEAPPEEGWLRNAGTKGPASLPVRLRRFERRVVKLPPVFGEGYRIEFHEVER